MTNLVNQHWINFNGEPVTGRTPPKTTVYGPPVTPQQQGEVAHTYKLFCDANNLALGQYQVRNRTLADGTRIRCTSINGVDQVQVWTNGEVAGREEYAGFAFLRKDDAGDFDPPTNLDMSWSRLSQRMTTIKGIETDREKFFKLADNKYGLGSWHGDKVHKVFSWDMASVSYLAGGHLNVFLNTAAQQAGCSGTACLGSGTKIYHKSNVLLDITNPDFLDPGGDHPLPEDRSALTIQGAAMHEKHLVFAVATPAFGSTPYDSLTIQGTNAAYEAWFFKTKLSRRLTPQGYVTTASRELEFIAYMNHVWVEANKVVAEELCEETYGANSEAGGPYLHYDYGTHSFQIDPYAKWLPITGWNFNASGTKARCTFRSGDLVNRDSLVIELDTASGSLSFVDVRLVLFSGLTRWPNGAGARVPGGVEIYEPPGGGSTRVIFGTDPGTDMTRRDLGYTYDAHGGYSDLSGVRFGVIMVSSFDGDTPVHAEIGVSDYSDEYVTALSIRRVTTGDPWVITSTVDSGQYLEERLSFWRDGVQSSSFVWGVRSSAALYERAGGVTTRTGGPEIVSYPSRVLFIEPVSESAAWIQETVEVVFDTSYSTPDYVEFFAPNYTVDYRTYTLNPIQYRVKSHLRLIRNGTLQDDVLLRTVTYPVTDDPVTTNPTLTAGPISSSSTSRSGQGFWQYAEFDHFHTNARKGEWILPKQGSGSINASAARFNGRLLYSIRAYLETLPEFTPWVDVGSPTTILETVDNVTFIDPTDPPKDLIELIEMVEADKPWLEKISIF